MRNTLGGPEGEGRDRTEENGESMTSTRRAATVAGILFLVGTAAGVLSVGGAAEDPDYLCEIAGSVGLGDLMSTTREA
jgi:hypothetical protein